MHNKLSYDQTAELRKRMRNDTFDREYEIKTLIRLGYHPDIADLLISNVVLGFQDQLFDEIKEAKQSRDKKEFVRCIVIMFSVFNTVLGENNIFLTLITVIIACLAGYFAFPEKRILAISGFVFGCIAMPFIYTHYLQNTDYPNLKVIILTAFSFGPAVLVKYIVSKLKYSEED